MSPDIERYQPPVLGEQMFAHDPANPDSFVWVGHGGWFQYITGYRKAARLLVANIEDESEDSTPWSDQLVYPAVFLYRQYLELQMKDFIQNAGPIVGVADDFERTHDLVRLWRTCREICETAWPGRHSSTLDAIEDQIGQLDRVDPGAFAFRYATNQDGSKSLPDELRSFNVALFARRVEAIADFIDGVDTGVYEEALSRADMAAEARAESANSADTD